MHGKRDGQMAMKAISNEIIKFHKNMILETYQTLKWHAQDIDCLMCHQVGARPHKQMASLASVDIKLAPITYKYFGNITSARLLFNAHIRCSTCRK